MKNTVVVSECQFLLLTAGVEKFWIRAAITSLCFELNLPVFVCDSQLVTASCLQGIEAKLLSHSGQNARPRLLVAGCYLEEQVNISALHGLYLGFEVFLLKDFIIARNRIHTQVYDSRLFQAGVVPSTLRQLLYEWISSEEQPNRHAQLVQMLALIEKTV